MASLRQRTTRWVAANVAVGMAAVALVAGCGSAGAKPADGSSGKASSGRSPAGSTTSTTVPARVGATQKLTGPNGLALSVKLAAIVDPATPASSYDQASAGSRYVGLRYVITDTAPTGFGTNLIQDTHVVDSAGATVAPIVIDMANCPVTVFGGTVALQPHAPFTGCVNLELPTTAKVSSVVLSVAPGDAGQATWKA